MTDFLGVLEDFCADNYIWVITGAAIILAIIILIVTGSVIRAKRRGKKDLSGSTPREFFMEGEYDAILKEKADEAKEGNNGEIEIPTEHPLSININIERGRVQIGRGDYGETMCRIDETDEEDAEEIINFYIHSTAIQGDITYAFRFYRISPYFTDIPTAVTET